MVIGLLIGAFVACVVTGYLSYRFGRKRGLSARPEQRPVEQKLKRNITPYDMGPRIFVEFLANDPSEPSSFRQEDLTPDPLSFTISPTAHIRIRRFARLQELGMQPAVIDALERHEEYVCTVALGGKIFIQPPNSKQLIEQQYLKSASGTVKRKAQ